MADYWRDGRPLGMPAATKRARNDLGIGGGREVSGYLPDMAGHSYPRESNQPGSLDGHARNGLSLYHSGGLTSGEISNLGGSLGSRLGSSAGYLSGSPIVDPVLMGQRQGIASIDSGFGGKAGGLGLSYQRPDSQALREPLRRPDEHLPPDASNTLFVEGLPTDCTRREAAHIFRPFIGFKEVRLVQKEPKRPGGEPLVLCFVDFVDARCAATALEALQGYKFDETDRESSGLKLQFARFPGPRGPSGSGRDEYRGNRGDRDDGRTRSR
ncbi:hypothetical protein KI387_015584, partial [Taxus chinensis]